MKDLFAHLNYKGQNSNLLLEDLNFLAISI